MFAEQVLGYLVILKADPVNQVLFGQVFFQRFREFFLLRLFISLLAAFRRGTGFDYGNDYTIFSSFPTFIYKWLFFAIF
jgi:hypothetical protein